MKRTDESCERMLRFAREFAQYYADREGENMYSLYRAFNERTRLPAVFRRARARRHAAVLLYEAWVIL